MLTLSLVGGLAISGSTLFASLVDADGTGVIVKIDVSTGAVSLVAGGGRSGDDGPAASASLSGPAGLALLPSGEVVVAEFGGNRVRKVTSSGRLETIAGGNPLVSGPPSGPPNKDKVPGTRAFFSPDLDAVGDGGPATKAVIRGPREVIIGQNGNLYVSEAGGHRVRQIDRNGIITTVAGTGRAGFSGDGGPAVAAQLHAPQGLALTTAGALFIGDTFNQRVRVVLGGLISTLAGSGTRGFGGDGGPATAASLARPGMLALIGGALLVGDEGNRLIREIGLI